MLRIIGIVFGIIFLPAFIVEVIKGAYTAKHCPDCGKRLGRLKENSNGWLYRECKNPKCDTQAVGIDSLLNN